MTTEIISMMEASLPGISVGILNQLLQCIGKSGKIETMIKVIQKFSNRFLVTEKFKVISNTFVPVYAVLLQDSHIRCRNQLNYILNFVEESFKCWKLEEIH